MKGFSIREQVEAIKAAYPAGTKVVLNMMDDPCAPVPPGTEGIVEGVDDAGQIMMKWKMITSAQDEVKTLKLEYARMVTSAEDKAAHLKEMDQYYEEFLGWAEEFELATMQRKRMILSELLERVEVGKGYKVTLKINLSYSQLLDMAGKAGVEIQNSDEVA